MADLLVVCRANLCRSPAVELLLRAELGGDSRLEVASAGLRPADGLSVPVEVAGWLAARRLDVSGHRPRGLRRADVEAAAVVVVMTRSQRSALVTTFPAALRRTVLLAEAADRVELADDGSVRVRPGSVPGARDLVDPYGRPADEVAQILGEADQEVRRLGAVLRPRHAAVSLHGVSSPGSPGSFG